MPERSTGSVHARIAEAPQPAELPVAGRPHGTSSGRAVLCPVDPGPASGHAGGPDDPVHAVVALAIVVLRLTDQRDLLLAVDEPGTPRRARVLRVGVYPTLSAAELEDAVRAEWDTTVPVELTELVALRPNDSGRPCHAFAGTGPRTGAEQLLAWADLGLIAAGGPDTEIVLDEGAAAPGEPERLARIVATVGADARRRPHLAVADLDILDPARLERQLRGWNATDTVAVSDRLPDAVARHAAARPDAPAVSEPGRAISYAELDDHADKLATMMHDFGVQHGDRIAVLLDRGIDNLVAQIASMRAGAAVVLVDPEYPAQRVEHIVLDSGATAVLTRTELLGRAGGAVPCGTVCLDRDIDWNGLNREPPRVALSDDDVCHVAYTSGSTGRPKAVLQRHGGLRNLAEHLIAACDLRPESRATWLSSPGFGVVEVDPLPVLCAGGSVHVPDPQVAASPPRLQEWLGDARITDPLLPTAMAERLWALGSPAPATLATMRVAGERLRRWPPRGIGYEVVNVYGSAEATVVSTCPLTSLMTRLGPAVAELAPPVGRPIPNVRTYVLDERLAVVAPGTVGELFVSGAGLSAGYWRHADATDQKFLDNRIDGDPYPILYRTGDRARYWEDGTIEIVGRDDGEVKIRGYRVHLGEVETALIDQPGVAQAAVVTCNDRAGERRLVGYLGLGSGADRSTVLGTIRSALRLRLPDYMVPTLYVTMPELPLTPNGKIDTDALPPPSDARPELAVPFRAPAGPVEELVAELWTEVLGISGIGVDDDFVELGGDSLRAMNLITLLRERADAEIGLSDLFDTSTVAELAPLVAGRAGTASAAWPQLVPAPLDAHEPFPLTEVQQALWIGRTDAVAFGSVGAHGYFEYEQIDFDVPRFRAAWARLIERHDMLRAVLLPDGTQQVLAEAPFDPIRVEDLSRMAPDDAWDRAHAVRAEMSHQVLDAHRWPLFDVRATLLPGGIARLHFGLDMLILDAWSAFQVLFDELIRLYEDPHAPLTPLEVTFRDYVLGRRAALDDSAALERSRRYWQERIDTLPAAPDLPMVTPSAADATRFDRLELFLDEGRWTTLQERAAAIGGTPSGILVAVFAEVLRSWSSDPRFTINFPIFDRMPVHPQVEALLGDFTNTVLVAAEPEGETFSDRAAHLQGRLWRDLEHRHLNGVEVLREITRRHGGALRPSMPIVVTSLLGQPDRRQVSALGTETFGISQTPQVLLDVQVREIDRVLHVKWDYLGAHFPPGVVESMFSAFGGLLDALVDRDDTWTTHRFDLLPSAQRCVRARVNDTAAELPDVRLSELLDRQVRSRPDAVAVVSADRRMTYGELGAEVAALATDLRGRGVRPDHPVAVVMHKGWPQLVAAWAAVVAGAPYLPIDPEVPAERLHFLLSDGAVECVLTTPDLAASASWPETVELLEVTRPTTGTDAGAMPLPEPVGTPDDLAYLIYTSGSTGTPKGVMVEQRGLLNHVVDVHRRMGVGPDDRALATSALHHDMSVFDVFGILCAGGTLVVPPPSEGPDPDTWADLIRAERVTWWGAVPAVVDVTVTRAASRGLSLDPLTRVVLAGDWIPTTLPDRLRALAPQVEVIGSGGPTETVNWSIVHPIGEVDPTLPSIPYGRPMSNQRYHVLDDELGHRPDWVPGEMWVGSEVGLARGYWNAPEKTAERFRTLPGTGERIFATGDLGRYLPDGTIEILGRNDFQVKINGHRIELGEIEANARAHDAVAEAIAVAPREASTRRLVLFVTPAAGAAPDPDEVRRLLSDRLPAAMVPHDVRVLDELPLSGNGKVDRLALVARATESDADREGADGDGSRFEQLLAQVFASVLETERCGVHSNFFRAGGDSVSGVRVAAQLEELLAVPVSVRSVLLAPTPVELARTLAADPEIGTTVEAIASALSEWDDEQLGRVSG